MCSLSIDDTSGQTLRKVREGRAPLVRVDVGRSKAWATAASDSKKDLPAVHPEEDEPKDRYHSKAVNGWLKNRPCYR
jgi:hypothetical protein